MQSRWTRLPVAAGEVWRRHQVRICVLLWSECGGCVCVHRDPESGRVLGVGSTWVVFSRLGLARKLVWLLGRGLRPPVQLAKIETPAGDT